MSVKELLHNHTRKYPLMQEQDILKLIFQHVFGGEHFIQDETMAYEKIKEECSNLTNKNYLIEDIGNNHVRFHLFDANEIECYTLTQLFIASCKYDTSNKDQFFTIVKELDIDYKEKDLQPFRHSQTYRDSYHPHYRILDKRLATYYPLFLEINRYRKENKDVVIAIDGKAASGKSTLAKFLCDMYQANIFHLDDFFLQPHQRVPERLLKPGGNVDHERFKEQVLLPLSKKETVHYQRFQCHTMTLEQETTPYPYTPVTIIEGSYSMLEELRQYYDITVALTLEDIKQIGRIYQRNDEEHALMFQSKWIPLENEYLNYYNVFKQVDYLFDTTDLSL